MFAYRTDVRKPYKGRDVSATQSVGPDRSLTVAVMTFCQHLRAAGVATSPTEAADALRALGQVDLTDRGQFRAALAATVAKRPRDQEAFDRLFSTHFALRRAPPTHRSDRSETDEAAPLPSPDAVERAAAAGDDEQREIPSDAVLRALLDALRSGDDRALHDLASAAVSAYGGIEQDRLAGEKYYVYRVVRQLELSRLLQQAMRQALDDLEGLDAHVVRHELNAHLETLRRAIAEEIRRQLVHHKGPETARDVLRPGMIEEVDFVEATRSDVEAMRELVRPLARRLAARVAAKRRRHTRGRLDVRRTMRHSLSTGGVPMAPAFKRPRVSRPELVVLADLSGSMAEFAAFTITLLHAMTEEIGRIRSFAFVDGIDEVTALFEAGASRLSVRNLLARSDVVADDGHSDYGAVLERFERQYGGQVSAKTTVIILGDARGNHRDPGLDRLLALHRRVRKLYFLNPEPRPEWDTSDSVISELAAACDGVFEVRNLRQLENAVVQIL